MKAQDIATVFPCAGICLGIDPVVDDFDPLSPSLRRQFESRLESHARVLETCDRPLSIKPNLAFFLRFGSWGIGLLETFCARFRQTHPVLLDAKFSEISNSLQGYLDFAFGALGVQAITLNPFLGERTIRQALGSCIEHTAGFGRVYVLCATSESGTALAGLQDPAMIIAAVQDIKKSIGPSQEHCPVGLVIGAARKDVLARSDLIASGLPLLCPGLGAQGADWGQARELLHSCSGNSALFPLSRYIFEGGRLAPEQALERLALALQHLATGAAPVPTQNPTQNPTTHPSNEV
jgi:orotidine 5'-phosphate decarboxylase subfamily 2